MHHLRGGASYAISTENINLGWTHNPTPFPGLGCCIACVVDCTAYGVTDATAQLEPLRLGVMRLSSVLIERSLMIMYNSKR